MKNKIEVTAEFFRYGLSVTTKTKADDPKYGLITVTHTANVFAPRKLITKALWDLLRSKR